MEETVQEIWLSCDKKVAWGWLTTNMSEDELNAIKLENLGDGLVQFKWKIEHDEIADELLTKIDNLV